METQTNIIEKKRIGSITFFVSTLKMDLKTMANTLGFDLQKRMVLDFENEFQEIKKIATEFQNGCPLIIQKSVFNKR